MFESLPTPPEPPSSRRPFGSAAARLSELAQSAPGPDTVAALSRIDPDRLDAGGKVDYLRAVQRASAWLASMEQRGLSAIDVAADKEPRRPTDFDDDWAREQVGTALRLHPITASRRLTVARTLVDRFPATLQALAEGRISY